MEIIELALKKKKEKEKENKKRKTNFHNKTCSKHCSPKTGAVCAFCHEHRLCPQPGTETWCSWDGDTVFLADQTALVFLDIFTKDEDRLPSRRASSWKTVSSSSDREAKGNRKRS